MVLHPVFKVKKLFFDQKKLIEREDKQRVAVLMRVGGRVRKTAQFSMRPGGKAGKSAKTGEPPKTHKKKGIKRFLYFSYDPKTRKVLVGPVKLSVEAKGVPKLLEEGGLIHRPDKTIKVKNKPGGDSRGKFVSAGESEVVIKAHVAKYGGNPYMQPALSANESFLVQEFQKGGIL